MRRLSESWRPKWSSGAGVVAADGAEAGLVLTVEIITLDLGLLGPSSRLPIDHEGLLIRNNM